MTPAEYQHGRRWFDRAAYVSAMAVATSALWNAIDGDWLLAITQVCFAIVMTTLPASSKWAFLAGWYSGQNAARSGGADMFLAGWTAADERRRGDR